MWLLVFEHETDKSLRGKTIPLLLDKEKYEVGRDSSCEINIPDSCVSRKHAILYPVKDNVKLEDEKSTFGTFVNGTKTRIPKDAHTFLKHDDLIRFGRPEIAWRLQKVDISVITTKLDPRESVELKSLLRVLNGNHVLSDWSNSVTHLVAPSVNFTTKSLLALVNGVPIVNLNYFRDAVSSVKTTGALPDVSKYVHSMPEDHPEVYDFSVRKERKTLFNGLIFIFLEERDLKAFEKIIKSAGGTATIWDKKKTSIIRVASRVIGDGKTNSSHQETADYLLGKGRRLIPTGEIGLAIATVSIEKFCNPKYHAEMNILALETPFVQATSSDVVCMEVVPETIVIDDEEEEKEVGNKTKLRDKTVISNTEVPETVVDSVPVNDSQFPDDDDDVFSERSQQILDLVDKFSSPAQTARSTKRKHSQGSDSDESSQKSKKVDSQSQSEQPTVSRFNSSLFIARPSQKTQSQVAPEADVPRPPAPSKPKRTLADLLANNDEDSEDELLMNFKKKPKPSSVASTGPSKKPIPQLRSVDEPDKSTSKVSESAEKEREATERVRLSQITGWLSKTFTQNCSIKKETLDESRAWIAPLLNSIQVKEMSVDLSNYSRNKTGNTTENISNSSVNASGKKNFKTFKKQSFSRCYLDAELAKTKSVLISEKL